MQSARFAASIALASLVGCRPSIGPDVLATSDQGNVTRADLDAYVLTLPEDQRKPPQGEAVGDWQLSLLNQMVSARALDAELAKREPAQTPDLQEGIRQRVDPILVEAARNRRLANVHVEESVLHAYYDSHPEEFGHPEQIRLRNLYRRVARDAPPDVRERARKEVEAILDEIRHGASFGDLAREKSDSETANIDGLIGRLSRGDLDPSIEKIVWDLPKGGVSDVIATPVGFQLFKLEERIPEFHMPFEEARGRLLRRLQVEASDAELGRYFQEMVAASGAKYDPAQLEASDPNAILFELEGDRLTVSAWRSRLDNMPFHEARDRPEPEILGKVARDRLLLWDARRAKLADDPAVAGQIAAARRQVMQDLLYSQWLEREMVKLDKELHASYEETIARHQSPKLYHLRILTKDFPGDEPTYDVYEQLARIAGEIRSGSRDFAAAAKELSDDISASRGGNVGFIRLDSFAEWAGPRAQHAVEALTANQVSDPLLIERYEQVSLKYRRQGYMLVMVEEVQFPHARPFEEVKEKVAKDFMDQSDRAPREEFTRELLAIIHAKIYPEHLVAKG
ncbi:MAG: peptidylprolyl isomerase [Acidobacteriota bacterium]